MTCINSNSMAHSPSRNSHLPRCTMLLLSLKEKLERHCERRQEDTSFPRVLGRSEFTQATGSGTQPSPLQRCFRGRRGSSLTSLAMVLLFVLAWVTTSAEATISVGPCRIRNIGCDSRDMSQTLDIMMGVSLFCSIKDLRSSRGGSDRVFTRFCWHFSSCDIFGVVKFQENQCIFCSRAFSLKLRPKQ